MHSIALLRRSSLQPKLHWGCILSYSGSFGPLGIRGSEALHVLEMLLLVRAHLAISMVLCDNAWLVFKIFKKLFLFLIEGVDFLSSR